jgi:hypothetical protein
MDRESLKDALPGGMLDWLLDRGITPNDFEVAGKLSESDYQFRLVNGDEMADAISKTDGPPPPTSPELQLATALGILLGIEHERAGR